MCVFKDSHPLPGPCTIRLMMNPYSGLFLKKGQAMDSHPLPGPYTTKLVMNPYSHKTSKVKLFMTKPISLSMLNPYSHLSLSLKHMC